MIKKTAFTIAELLITLMIIGVVAVMTIPVLTQSTAAKEYKSLFKKSVAVINHAIALNYVIDGRNASDYSMESFDELLKERLNILSVDEDNNSFYSADGMYFHVLPNQGGDCTVVDGNLCAVIEIDVNGKKGPNRPTTSTTQVFDIFTLLVYPQKAVPQNEIFTNILYSK